MKKQLIGAAAALVMLAGCGDSAADTQTKTCTIDSGGQEVKIVMTAEDEIVKTFTISAGVEIGDVELSDEELAAFESMMISQLGFEEGDGVQVNVENQDGVLNMEIVLDASKDSQFIQSLGIDIEDDTLQLDMMVSEMEAQGATCD